MKHLTAYQILSGKQYDFRPNHSCETQLLNVVEEIQLALDHHLSVDLMFIDFCKTFDTVSHLRLMKKLYHYGIQGNVYNWIFSYLTKRTQRVVIKGHSSTYIHVDSGVPQGTVLGPLTFLLYITSMTLLLILLLLSDYLQTTVFYTVSFTQNRIIVIYNKT